jgi:large subunit ribosomal protein L25
MPSDLPEFITVDLVELKKGASLHLKSIKLPKGVSAVTKGSANNPVVVTAIPPLVIEEAPAADAVPADAAPAKGKGKKK